MLIRCTTTPLVGMEPFMRTKSIVNSGQTPLAAACCGDFVAWCAWPPFRRLRFLGLCFRVHRFLAHGFWSPFSGAL